MASISPLWTVPGWERQVSGVAVGTVVAVAVGEEMGLGVGTGGIAVGVDAAPRMPPPNAAGEEQPDKTTRRQSRRAGRERGISILEHGDRENYSGSRESEGWGESSNLDRGLSPTSKAIAAETAVLFRARQPGRF